MLKSIISNMGAVVLAAGRGTRLQCADRPKVLCEIGGRPLVDYTVQTLKSVGFSAERLVLVVGFMKDKVKAQFGASVLYADQDQQLGTAHAAHVGIQALPQGVNEILVMGGDDSAFYTPETIQDFLNEHIVSGATLSVLTAEFDNPPLIGRVIRDDTGKCIAIREKEQLSEAEKKIKEVNTGTYCLNRRWFENIFPRMPKIEGLGEWGLNRAIEMAVADGKALQAVKIKNPEEWFGVNTPEELAEADRRKRRG